MEMDKRDTLYRRTSTIYNPNTHDINNDQYNFTGGSDPSLNLSAEDYE
jgi:hypothetical protein